MDSKTADSALAREEEARPPSYDDTISSSYPTSPLSTSKYYSSQIQSQLQTLHTKISSIQAQREILSHAQEEKILSLLTHHIQLYISDFATTGHQKGSLILVPAVAIQDPKATPTDYDFSKPSEYDRVVKVSDKEFHRPGAGDLWYWEEEDMAKRLAACLRPPPSTIGLPKRTKEVPAQTKAKGWGFFGRKKSDERPPLIDDGRDSTSQEVTGAMSLGREGEDRVVVDVKAEQVVFRTENEYGMFGTVEGWAVVVKLGVILHKR